MSGTNRLTLTGIAALLAATLLPRVSAQTRPIGDNAPETRVIHLEDLAEIRMVYQSTTDGSVTPAIYPPIRIFSPKTANESGS
jgi:hypothetical protein